jgi:hypothetical protein
MQIISLIIKTLGTIRLNSRSDFLVTKAKRATSNNLILQNFRFVYMNHVASSARGVYNRTFVDFTTLPIALELLSKTTCK